MRTLLKPWGRCALIMDTLFSREPRLVIRPDDVPFLPMYPKSRFHQTKGSAAYVYASAASVHGKIATMETGQHIGLIRDRFHTVSPASDNVPGLPALGAPSSVSDHVWTLQIGDCDLSH